MLSMKRPVFIAFEGHDGVGKTTQSLMLDARLKSLGLRCKRVKMPSESGNLIEHVTGKIISFMANSRLAMMFPNVFNVLHFLNKMSFQNSTEDNLDVVILDRWKLSAIAYGKAMGASNTLIELIASKLMEPTISIILMSDRCRSSGDSLDTNTALQANVKDAYEYETKTRSNVIMISTNDPLMRVHERVMQAVHDVLPQYIIPTRVKK